MADRALRGGVYAHATAEGADGRESDGGHAPAERRGMGPGNSTEGPGVIEAWQRALVLAPHTDDGEFGCGGTMARLVEAGADVRYVAFSIATKSLPDGFAPD